LGVAGENVETASNGTAVSASDLREQILASIPSEDAPEAKPEPEEEAEDDQEDAVEASPDETEDSEEEADVEDEDSDEEAKPDPKAAKGLDAVRLAEKRSREVIARERQTLTAEREQHKAELEQLAEFRGHAKRIKYDPGAVLRTLGASEDDFEIIAQALYAESKAGAADPKRKEAATRLLREREKEDKLTATEKRLEDLEKRLEAQRQEEAVSREAADFYEQMNAAAAAKFPLVAHMLKVDQEDSVQALVSAYERVMKRTGGKPKPAAVVAEYDRAERARLKRIGVDPDTLAKAKITAKPGAKPVADKSAPIKGAKTRDEILAELDDAELD
jgi:hypothetical protein